MLIEPFISVSPTRISMYQRSTSQSLHRRNHIVIQSQEDYSNNQKGAISKKAAQRIKNRVSWLSFIAEDKKRKIAFVTLTLPSVQVHTDKEIKSLCLNQFLTELRQKFNVKNYIWKAELQQNKNIHFHITTDVYIHHEQIKRIWNRIINKLGYVDRYQEKFMEMGFASYRDYRRANKKPPEKSILKAYEFGQATRWMSPNTIDVRSVRKVRNLANYLAKYLSKNPTKEDSPEEFKERVKAFGGNLWYSSQSLSKVKNYIALRCNKAENFIDKIASCVGTNICEYDYAICMYFNFSSLPRGVKKDLSKMLKHQLNLITVRA